MSCDTCTELPMIWDQAETLPRQQLQSLQLQRLNLSLQRASQAGFYRQRLRSARLLDVNLHSLEQLRQLPFTSKEDLRQNYPLNLRCVPRADIVRIHGSSGTTGRPTFVAYSANDLRTWANLCARFLAAGGLRREHMAQIAFGYGLFTGGFGLHYGIEALGASVVPAGGGNTARQVMLLQDLQVDAIICTPSYALNVAEVARSEGIDPRELALKLGFFGGEMWTEDMRTTLEQDFAIRAFNNYGLSEIMGPGVSGECFAQDGMHIQEDHFIVECIDPDTLEPVPPGQPGELVFTTLTKEAMPILRYRTRDIATLDDRPCRCGRTSIRMGRVAGRTDDMLIIRGVNVFPSQVEEALLRVEGTAPHYQIELSRPGNLDIVTVRVEVREQDFSDKMSQMQDLRGRIDQAIHTVTGVRMRVELVEPRTLARTDGKAVRVIDKRKEF